MKYTTGRPGRVFVLRLEHGDPIYGSILDVARKEKVQSAVVWIIGGIANAGVVVGPKTTDARPPVPVVKRAEEAHELLGTGMIFPDAAGRPGLHMHAALGRGVSPVVGCPREGADCWLVDEVVILELCGIKAGRTKDAASGFELLTVFP